MGSPVTLEPIITILSKDQARLALLHVFIIRWNNHFLENTSYTPILVNFHNINCFNRQKEYYVLPSNSSRIEV